MSLEIEVVADAYKFDVVIVGGSLSGMLAAIYLKNKGIKCAFLEKGLPGGSLRNVNNIKNFMNITSINGSTLCDQIFNHAIKEVKIPYFFADIQTIKQQPNEKFYLYHGTKVWEAKIIIFACKPEITTIQFLNNLKVTNNKFIVNQNNETSLKNIYAIGPAVGCNLPDQQMQSANKVVDVISQLIK